jgi:hypothetical protein
MAIHALVLDWQTVLMHPVSASRASAGALRHAQSFVTSSQPEGSASPMGIRQLKMQEGCDVTAGRTVMVYSGEIEVDTAVLMGMSLIEIDMELGVDDLAWARGMKSKRRLRSMTDGDIMIV